MNHPLELFQYCPHCGSRSFEVINEKAKACRSCGFEYYFNPSAAVACFIKDGSGRMLVVRRGREPEKGTLDTPGGFVDRFETAEEAAAREVKEETGLDLISIKYLFSLPNIYPFKGFDVHTLDLFFECTVEDVTQAVASDDAAETIILTPDSLDPKLFGLRSVRKAVGKYRESLGLPFIEERSSLCHSPADCAIKP